MKSFEKRLYETCPALANYENNKKALVEFNNLGQQKAISGQLFNDPNANMNNALYGKVRMLVDFATKEANGDEKAAITQVFQTLMAVAGHRHTVNLRAVLQQFEKAPLQ